MNNIENENTIIYPYCYEIKEGCPPCLENMVNNTTQYESDDCLELLANYVVVSESIYRTKEEKDDAKLKLGVCLKKLGDLYSKVNIELYVNPNSKNIVFPDQQRIQSSFNEFLRQIGNNKANSPREDNLRIEKLKIFNILLNNKFRNIYNNLYISSELAEPKSLKPKEYGIARIMGAEKKVGWSPDVSGEQQNQQIEVEEIGGRRKKKRKTKRKKSVKSRTKRRMRKNKKN